MMRLVVLGGGESGVGAAILGQKKGWSVFLSDTKDIDVKYKDKLVACGIPFEEGGHTEEYILDADLVIKSPGIPNSAPIITKIRSNEIDIVSEIEFASRYSDAKMYCITGSNGKTTTTLLLYHILKNAGRNVGLAGNVGFNLAEQVCENKCDEYVVELSSFQLDDMYAFKADVAILMNITPDHLDRYAYKMENYVESKFRIIQNMEDTDLFISCKDDLESENYIAHHDIIPVLKRFSFSDIHVDSYVYEKSIIVRWMERELIISEEIIPIKGRHNMYNVMAASLAALKLGLSDEQIIDGIRTFTPVEHRLEPVRVFNGIEFVNDSKATNVDSAWYALDAFDKPIVWIAGGTDKGNDYSVLYELVKSKVKTLICMGIDNSKLVDSFERICPVVSTNSLEEAMQKVIEIANEGDVVLLSPCCASFDLFKSYVDRGCQFKKAVNSL